MLPGGGARGSKPKAVLLPWDSAEHYEQEGRAATCPCRSRAVCGVPRCLRACASRGTEIPGKHTSAPALLHNYSPYILISYPPTAHVVCRLGEKKMKKMKKMKKRKRKRKRKRDANAGMLREYGNKKWREVIRVSENRSSKAIAEGSEIIARSGSAEG